MYPAKLDVWKFGLEFHLHPYFVSANFEGSHESSLLVNVIKLHSVHV